MALKVWKNSSWVRSRSAMNWMSSMSSTSMRRYRPRKSSIFCSRIELMKSFVNFSLVAYRIRLRGNLADTALPMACIRCVLPRPTPPYRKSGL